MLIVMKQNATPGQVEAVVERIRSLGLTPHAIPGAQRTAIGITGNKGGLEGSPFEGLPGVGEVLRVSQPFKLVSREVQPEDTVIDVDGVELGGRAIAVMAGPCSVESREQLWRRRTPSRRPGRASCAAAPSSRAPAPTSSRGWARPGSSCSPRRASRPASRWSPR